MPHTSLLGGVISSLDPNNDSKTSSIGFWLIYADFYQLEHLINFSSLQKLVQKLRETTPEVFESISSKMAAQNARTMKSNYDSWRDVVTKTKFPVL